MKKNNPIDDILKSISEQEQLTTDKKMMLAVKIANAIEKRGWNKLEFAQKMGFKNSSIVTRWLSGTHNFSIETLIKMEDLLEISLLDIEESHQEFSNSIVSNPNFGINSWVFDYQNSKNITIN